MVKKIWERLVKWWRDEVSKVIRKPVIHPPEELLW